MKDLTSLALKVEGGRLRILDQTRLPFEEVWLDASDPGEMAGHIQRLAVRGAPLIGVAAALSLAAQAEAGTSEALLRTSWAELRKARPTAVNLMAAMDRMKAVLESGGGAADLVAMAEGIFDEDAALCEAMAARGVGLLGAGETVLTHCNSGGLATAGIGTALGVIRRGFDGGRVARVYVDETRPVLLGARLTDSMAAILLREGRVSRVLVGADRIARNGDFANKVGTYGLAVQARHHGVPFHPVAPWTTVDLACADGAQIPIEDRKAEEVRGFGASLWASDCEVFNPSFDVTPAALVTSLVLDRGVVEAAGLQAGALARWGS